MSPGGIFRLFLVDKDADKAPVTRLFVRIFDNSNQWLCCESANLKLCKKIWNTLNLSFSCSFFAHLVALVIIYNFLFRGLCVSINNWSWILDRSENWSDNCKMALAHLYHVYDPLVRVIFFILFFYFLSFFLIDLCVKSAYKISIFHAKNNISF